MDSRLRGNDKRHLQFHKFPQNNLNDHCYRPPKGHFTAIHFWAFAVFKTLSFANWLGIGVFGDGGGVYIGFSAGFAQFD
jgi:hypothetical protein